MKHIQTRGWRSGMRKKRLIVLSVLMFAIQLAVAGSGSASPNNEKSLPIHYSCDSLVNFLPADADTVREVAQIPPEFTLKEDATGRTVLFFWQLSCDHVTGDARGTGPFTGLTVNLEGPPADVCPSCGGGGYGASGYDIFQLTNDPKVHAEYTRVGALAALVRDLSVSFDYVGGLPVAAEVSASWEDSGYEISATIAPATLSFLGADACFGTFDAAGCIPSDHWYKGDQGFLYTANSNCEISAAAATTVIEAEPDTPLARMFGATRIEAPGFWVRIREGTGLVDQGYRFEAGNASRPECAPLP